LLIGFSLLMGMDEKPAEGTGFVRDVAL